MNPSGLGFDLNNSFVQLGNGWFAASGSTDEIQPTISCDLIFTAGSKYIDPESCFLNFTTWLLQSPEITLFRGDPNDNTYRRRVVITSIGKTERHAGALSCSSTIMALEPWHKQPVGPLAMTLSGSALTCSVFNDGQMPAPFILRCSGGVTNPKVALKSSTGKTIGLCELYTEIGADEVLILNTNPAEPRIYKTDSDGLEVDLIQYVDISHDPFPLIPISGGVVELTAKTTPTATATVAWTNLFRSV